MRTSAAKSAAQAGEDPEARAEASSRTPAGPRIRVLTDGPYVVREVSVSRTAQVETEYGEPVDWAPLEPLDPEDPARYKLCRCGLSKTKPFCDDSHEGSGFDGTETADRGPRIDRAYAFDGDGIVMTDDRSLCTQAGYCGDRFTNVWKMLSDSSDPAVRERIQHMVSLCPSGRLDWAPDEQADPVEPPFEPSVAVVRDGPIWVRGRVTITGADGERYEVRNRVTLCRCGHSENKPFCDGSHKEIGFRG
jgi:CDGSH-type Zn-finger protein